MILCPFLNTIIRKYRLTKINLSSTNTIKWTTQIIENKNLQKRFNNKLPEKKKYEKDI